jgi:hypothetical protein
MRRNRFRDRRAAATAAGVAVFLEEALYRQLLDVHVGAVGGRELGGQVADVGGVQPGRIGMATSGRSRPRKPPTAMVVTT